MLFRDEVPATATSPTHRGARLGEELLVPIRRQLGTAIDAQRDLHDPDLEVAAHPHCVLRVLLHPESTWPLIAPMRQPLREKLQRSADRHAEYREMSVKFEVRLEPAPTSSGPPFAIVVGEEGSFAEPVPAAAPTVSGTSGVQTPPLRAQSQARSQPTGVETSALLRSTLERGALHGISTEVVANASLRLEVLGANGAATEVYDLDTGSAPVSVGRDGAHGAEPDIAIACDPTVSAVQLLLRVTDEGDGVELRNVGRNRVFVNDQPVEGAASLKGLQKPSVAHAGDVITLGHKQPVRLRIADRNDNLSALVPGRGVYTEPVPGSPVLGADPHG